MSYACDEFAATTGYIGVEPDGKHIQSRGERDITLRFNLDEVKVGEIYIKDSVDRLLIFWEIIDISDVNDSMGYGSKKYVIKHHNFTCGNAVNGTIERMFLDGHILEDLVGFASL